jgi:hypothetical protein
LIKRPYKYPLKKAWNTASIARRRVIGLRGFAGDDEAGEERANRAGID